MASQQPTQLPPPSVGTPFSETVGGLAHSSDAYSKASPDTSAHATAPGPPLGSRNPYVVQASDVPTGAGTQPKSVSAIPPPQLGAASSAAHPGGLSDFSSTGAAQHGSSTQSSLPSAGQVGDRAQQAKDNVAQSLPSTDQIADRAQQAKDSAAQTGAQAGAAIGGAAQSAKATIQSAELPAAPAQRPEGAARLESQDGVKNIISGIGGILVSAPGAALEAVANKAGHPEIAQQIQAGVARVSGQAVDLGKAGYANAPTAEQVKGSVASGYNALPTAGQVRNTAVNAHQSLPSVEQVKSTTGNLGQTAAHHAGTAQQYATQIAHDLAEKLPASLQAYVPESIKHPQSATSPATSATGTTGSHPVTTTTNTVGHQAPSATSQPAPAGAGVIGGTMAKSADTYGASSTSAPHTAGTGLVGGSATQTAGVSSASVPAYPNAGQTGTGQASATTASPLTGSAARSAQIDDLVAKSRA